MDVCLIWKRSRVIKKYAIILDAILPETETEVCVRID